MNRLAISCVVVSVAGCLTLAQPVPPDTAGPGSGNYSVVSVTIDPNVKQPLQKIDTVIQVGTNAMNRFTMHHVYHREGIVKGSIILVPSAYSNFAMYMIGDGHGRMQSLAETLAREHYDVFGYSPRTTNVPARACSSGHIDCSVMKDWGLAAYVQDIEFIRMHASGRYKPVVGGLSLGAIAGLAAVNANPSGYSGLLLWEGLLYSANPTVIALGAAGCSAFKQLFASGVYDEEDLAPSLKQAAQIGEAATIPFFGRPQPNVVPDWIQLATDPTGTNYAFASFPRLFEFIMNFNNIEAGVPLLRDIDCSIAGDTTFVSNLRNFTAPVLAIESGLSYAHYMHDEIALTGSTRIRIESVEAFGHLDAFLTADHVRYADSPILDWLKTDVFRH